MEIIRPNCRVRITKADMDFVLSALASSDDERRGLTTLMTDPDAVDHLLDSDALFRAVLDRPDCLTISNHLYFYILVRNVLRDAGVTDRTVADYVASILSAFSNIRRLRRPIDGEGSPMDYMVDMLAAMERADEKTRFLIRLHMGNHALYLTGVFPKHLAMRTERKAAPSLDYYEQMGILNFRAASDHRLAEQYDLAPVLSALSDSFRTTRLALNDMAERLIFLDESPLTSLILKNTDSAK